MTVRARHGVVADLAARRHPFLLITSKRSMQAALRRAKARTKPQWPGLHDLHVVAELLALAVLAGRAFYVRAEILVVFLRQFSLDVFHYPVLPPSEIIQRLAGAVDVLVVLPLRESRHGFHIVVDPLCAFR